MRRWPSSWASRPGTPAVPSAPRRWGIPCPPPSALEPGQVSDVIATDEGWYVAIGQTLDESSVLDEMFKENVTQARSELTVELQPGPL